MAKPKKTTAPKPTEKKPPKARTKKQTTIPGATAEIRQDIEDAALEFTEVRDQRMDLAEPEAEKKTALGALMKKHGLASYTMLDGRIVTYKDKADVHVRTPKDTSVTDAG